MAHLVDEGATGFDGTLDRGRQWHLIFAEFDLATANATQIHEVIDKTD
jgi:hypothetical protein